MHVKDRPKVGQKDVGHYILMKANSCVETSLWS